MCIKGLWEYKVCCQQWVNAQSQMHSLQSIKNKNKWLLMG